MTIPIHHRAGSNASTGLLAIGESTSYSNSISLSFAGSSSTPSGLSSCSREKSSQGAGGLPNNAHKLNLFLHFRSDKTIRSSVYRATPILAVSESFTGYDSKMKENVG